MPSRSRSTTTRTRPAPATSTQCRAVDFAELLGLSTGAGFDQPEQQALFDALDGYLEAHPQLAARWRNGTWQLLEAALSELPGDPGRLRQQATRLATSLEFFYITPERVRHVMSAGYRNRGRTTAARNLPLRDVLTVGRIVSLLTDPHGESFPAWHDRCLRRATRLAADVSDGYDPALDTFMQVAHRLDDRPGPMAIAITLHTLTRTVTPYDPNKAPAPRDWMHALAAAVRYHEGRYLPEGYPDEIGCPRQAAVVAELPACYDCGRPARYDHGMPDGAWAAHCPDCYQTRGTGLLGTGRGQRLITIADLPHQVIDLLRAADRQRHPEHAAAS